MNFNVAKLKDGSKDFGSDAFVLFVSCYVASGLGVHRRLIMVVAAAWGIRTANRRSCDKGPTTKDTKSTKRAA